MGKLVAPSIDFNRALGDLRSWGETEEGLNRLSSASINFTNRFGGSSADFVWASYDIQSAISSLTGDKLRKTPEAMENNRGMTLATKMAKDRTKVYQPFQPCGKIRYADL